MLDRKEIKSGLRFGSQREIARRAGTTETVVSQWFAGKFNSDRIESVAVDVYAECVAARQLREAQYEAAKRGEKLQ